MWKSGMTLRQRSTAVSSRASATLRAEAQSMRCVRGTSLGRDVVPEVCRRSATSSGSGAAPFPAARASPREAEDTGGVARIDIQLQDLDAPLGGDCPRGGVERGADHERVRPEIVEIERELLCPVRRVERSDRGGPRDREERARRLGAVLDQESDPACSPRPCALSWPAIVDVTSSRPS